MCVMCVCVCVCVIYFFHLGLDNEVWVNYVGEMTMVLAVSVMYCDIFRLRITNPFIRFA